MPPVGAAIVAIGTAINAVALSAGAAVGLSAAASLTAASVLGQLAIGVSLTALQRAMAVGQQGNGAPRAGVRVQGTPGEDASETVVFGKYAVPGELLYENVYDDYANLVQVYELSGWPSRINRVYINGEWCTLGGADIFGRGRPVLEYRRKGRDFLWVHLVSDGIGVTNFLNGRFGNDDDLPWSSDMVGRGLPTATVTSKFKQSVHRKVPDLLFEMEGTPLYDPRRDSTAGGSGAQRLANRDTWQPSSNPIVIAWNILHGLRDPETEEFVWGYGVPPQDLPSSSWFAAMNECDMLVGGRKQYECGIEVPIAKMAPADALEEVLNACQGQCVEVAGEWLVKAGPPTASVYAFTDADLIANMPTEFDPFPGLDEVPTGVAATYYEPEDGWAARVAPLKGNRGRVTKVSLPTVFSGKQAQFLAASAYKTALRFRRHTLVLPPEARRLSPLDVVTWTSEENYYTSKEFQVTMTKDLQDGCVALALLEVDPSDYDAPAVAPTDVGFVTRPTEVVGGVLNFDAQPTTIIGANGQTRAAIRLLWNKNIEFVEYVRWQVRLAASLEDVPGQGSLENPDAASGDVTRRIVKNGLPLVKNAQPVIAGRVEDVSLGSAVVSDGILGGTDYQARMRYEPTGGIWDWSDWVDVTTPDVRIGPEDLQPGLLTAITNAEAAVEQAITDAIADFDLIDTKVQDLEAQILAARGYTDSQIATVVTTIDGKNTIFYQATPPFATRVNDEWIRSTDNRRFRASTIGASGWLESGDSRIGSNTAAIANETLVRQAETQSLAAQLNTVSASLNGTVASVAVVQAALVELDEKATAGLTIRFKAGAANGELEFVASDDPINGPAVLGKLNGNLLIDGTISSRALVVTDNSGNLVRDGAIQDPEYWFVSDQGNGKTWDVITTTSRGSPPSKGELRYQTPYSYIQSEPWLVTPGDKFSCEFYYSSLSSGTAFKGEAYIRWGDKNDSWVSSPSRFPDFNRIATSPHRTSIEAVAPPTATTARIRWVPDEDSARGRVWAPSVRRKGDAGTLITPESITSDLVVANQALLTREVQAGVATIGTAALRNASITNAKVGTAAIREANIGDLQVNRLKIRDNAVGTWSFAQSLRGAKNGTNNIRILMEAPGDYMARVEFIVAANDSEGNDYSDYTWTISEGLASGSTSLRRVQTFSRSVLTGYSSLVLTGTTTSFGYPTGGGFSLYPSYLNFRFTFDHNVNGSVQTLVELSVLRRYK